MVEAEKEAGGEINIGVDVDIDIDREVGGEGREECEGEIARYYCIAIIPSTLSAKSCACSISRDDDGECLTTTESHLSTGSGLRF